MPDRPVTPWWRWMRSISVSESHALRAYARVGVVPPRSRPLMWVEQTALDYRPHRPIESLAVERPEPRRRRPHQLTSDELADLHPLVALILVDELEHGTVTPAGRNRPVQDRSVA